jgi:hypothetical protein
MTITESDLKKVVGLIAKRDAMVKRSSEFLSHAYFKDRVQKVPLHGTLILEGEGMSLPVVLTSEIVELMTVNYQDEIEAINKEIQALGILTVDQEFVGDY